MGGEKRLVNINSTLIWEIINFVLLLWLLKRVLYRPITEMIDKRKNKIKDELNEAARKKEEAEKLKETYELELKTAREKAQQIVEDAEELGKKRSEEIIINARQEASSIMERNMREIERAKEEALNELRKELVSISILVAGKFMQEKLEKSKHETLIKQYIDTLDKKKLGEV